MKLIKQIILYYKKDNSDKVYEIDFCEVGTNKYVVNFRYGRRESTLRYGTKTILPVTFNKAEKIYDGLIASKIKSGYKLSLSDFEKEESTVNTNIDDKASQSENIPELNDKRNQAVLHKISKLLNECVKHLSEKKPNNKALQSIQKSLGRAIWRAGELKIVEAEELLINNIGLGNELLDYSIIWALGKCCNNKEKVLNVLMNIYNNSSTSDMVKRITSEALLKIFDKEQKKDYINKLISHLPHTLIKVINQTPEIFLTELEKYLENASYTKYKVLYTLYQINNDVVRPTLIEIIKKAPLKPNYFKQIRHIFKTAEYRCDAEMFGIIAYKFEKNRAMFQSISFDVAYVEDSYYGNIQNMLKKPDSKFAYGSYTRMYLKRRVWRTLRRMGEINNPDYIKMAIEVLSQFTDSADAGKSRIHTFTRWYRVVNGNRRWQSRTIKTHYDTFAKYIAFNYILYKNSPRYHFIGKLWRCKDNYKPGDPEPNVREEAFPELWNEQYRELIKLLGKSKCKKVHLFGIKVLRDNKEFSNNPKVEDIIILLGAPYIETATLGFELFDKIYDPTNPNIKLLAQLANCTYEIARKKAFDLISNKKDYFITNNELLLSLITSDYPDTRKFIISLLELSIPIEENMNALFAQILSYLMLLASDKKKSLNIEKINNISDVLFKVFTKQCNTLGLEVLVDLIQHPVQQIQEIGAKILLNHDIYSKHPHEEIIQTLIKSKFNSVRGLGVRLFGQFPDEELIKQKLTLMLFITHDISEIREAIRPAIKRLAISNNSFGKEILALMIDKLFRIKNEEKLQFLTTTIKEDLIQISNLPIKLIWKLLNSQSTAIQEMGGFFLNTSDELNTLSVEQILQLTNNDVRLVREISWKLCKENIAKLKEGIDYTIKLLDAKWDDSREFAFDFIRKDFTKEDFTPKALVSMCDSVREKVQQFARELITKFFEDKHGEEYLLKLSEHPSPNIGLFVTNYFERYASDNPERLSELSNYFKRALCRVNKGRVVKERIFIFLEKEALKSYEASRVVAEILSFVSATISITYKALATKIMVKIHKKYPVIKLPIRLEKLEERHAV